MELSIEIRYAAEIESLRDSVITLAMLDQLITAGAIIRSPLQLTAAGLTVSHDVVERWLIQRPGNRLANRAKGTGAVLLVNRDAPFGAILVPGTMTLKYRPAQATPWFLRIESWRITLHLHHEEARDADATRQLVRIGFNALLKDTGVRALVGAHGTGTADARVKAITVITADSARESAAITASVPAA